MGVGYAASALHRIAYLEPVPGSEPGTKPPPFPLPPDAVWDARLTRFSSPDAAAIIAWRERISAKYDPELGERLWWDEESDFAQSEDVRTRADMLFRFVAAILDQRGPDTAATALEGATKPSPLELTAVFGEAERRGLAGRFPQLLLGARYWLPFQRNVIIEEPSWRGAVERYGSLFRLAEELNGVRDFIASTDASAIHWTAKQVAEPPNLLASAWQVSDTVSRLAAVAVSKRLPLWTTG
jgi:hypothetical protein